jgi:hypothetical protein
MAGPITWRNVQINSGASAAAFGRNAIAAGDAASRGLDKFNTAMQDRVEREDALRTNEAINAARSGGPQVSGDRRVDATALQESVQSRLLSEQRGEAHELALETGELSNIGQGLTNQSSQLDLDNYESDRQLKRQLDQANIDMKVQNTAESKIRVEDLQRQVTEAATQRKAAVEQNDYLNGGGRDTDIRAAWDAMDHGDDDALTQEADFVQYRDDVIGQSLSDPDYGPQMAHKFGFGTVKDWIANSDEGSMWAEARSANIAADVEEARERAKDKVIFTDGLDAYIAGGKDMILHDPGSPDGITFGKATGKITSDDQDVVLTDLDIDPEDDDSVAFLAKLNSEFKNPGMFKHVATSIIGDSEEIPDNYEQQIDGWAFTANERAKQLKNPTVFRTGGTPDQNYANTRKARASGQAEPKSEQEKKTTVSYKLPTAGTAEKSAQAIKDVLGKTEVTLDSLTPETLEEAEDWVYLANQMNQRIADPNSSYSSKKAASVRLAKIMKAIEKVEKENRKTVDTRSLDSAINKLL